MLSVACALSTAAIGKPFTVDDLLRLEDTGRAAFDPSNRFLAYEFFPAYEQAPEFGRTRRFGRDRPRLFIVDLAGADSARPLAAQESDAGYWLGPFSPTGRRLAAFVTRGGMVRLSVFDLTAHARTDLSPTPDILDSGVSPLWLSDDELVYAALAPGEEPWEVKAERESAESLQILWRRAWQGVQPTASVLHSGDVPHRARTAPRGHLVRANARTGVVATIDVGDFDELSLSPNRRHLAVLRRGDVIPPPRDRPWTPYTIARRSALAVYDLREASSPGIPVCEGCQVSRDSLRWSRDGGELLFVAKPTLDAHDIHVYRYRALTRSMTRVDPPGLTPLWSWSNASRPATAAWMGNDPVIFARRPRPAANMDHAAAGATRADWYRVRRADAPINLTERFAIAPRDLLALSPEALLLLADGDLWRVTKNAVRQNLTREIDTAVLRIDSAVAPGGPSNLSPAPLASLAAVRTRETAPRLLVADADAAALTAGIPLPAAAQVLAVSQRSVVAAIREDTMAGSRLSLAGGERPSSALMTFNRHMADVTGGSPIELTNDAVDGRRLSGWLLLPPGHRSGDRHPLIVHVYPGRVAGLEFTRSLWAVDPLNAYLLAAAGYGVLFPSLPLGPRGNASDPAVGLVDALMPAIEHVIALGYADRDCLALFGHSFGGLGVLAIVTETPRFKAAVAVAPLANLSSVYGSLDTRRRVMAADHLEDVFFGAQWAEGGQGRLSAPPWSDPARYMRNSPVFHADRIRTPVMLMQGDLDYVSATQSEEMFTALYRQGKRVTLVRYWGEGHMLSSPANIRDFWHRVVQWYGAHLSRGLQCHDEHTASISALPARRR